MKPDSSELNVSESLEQLRWLANGYKIRTIITQLESISSRYTRRLARNSLICELIF